MFVCKEQREKTITNYTRRNLCGKIIGRGFNSLHLHQKNKITAKAIQNLKMHKKTAFGNNKKKVSKVVFLCEKEKQ